MGDSVIRIRSSAHSPSSLLLIFNLSPIDSAASLTVKSSGFTPSPPLTPPSHSFTERPTICWRTMLSAPLSSPHLSSPQCQRLFLHASFSLFLLNPTKKDKGKERRWSEAVLRHITHCSLLWFSIFLFVFLLWYRRKQGIIEGSKQLEWD